MRYNILVKFTEEMTADKEAVKRYVVSQMLSHKIKDYRIIKRSPVKVGYDGDDFVRNLISAWQHVTAFRIPRFVIKKYNRNANRNNRIQRG